VEAIELYHKAQKYTESAKILSKMAQDSSKRPLRAKILYVLSALDMEKFRKKILESQMMSPKTTTETHLEGLRRHESSVGFDKSLDNPWRGAEAFHFFMLAQRQLYEENLHDALNTSCRLMEYDDILDKKEVYSLIALT